MAERSTIAQVVQLGIETVPGTGVAAVIKPKALGFTIAPQFETRVVRPAGSKWPTLSVLGKDWSQLGIAGEVDYEELMYPLSSVLCAQTEVSGGTHTFTPSITGADTGKTFTVEKGELAGEAEEVSGVTVNEFGLNFTRDAVEMSGSAFGQEVTFNTTMTAALTNPTTQTPVLPTDVCVYWDTSWATLGTTKLTRVLSASWQVTNRWTPLWVIDCAEDSYVATIEAVPEVNVSLVLMADNAANAFVDNYLRTGTKGFLEIAATKSAEFDLVIDTAMTVVSTGELGDQDGVYALTVNLTGVADATAGKVTEVVVKNDTEYATGAAVP